MNYGSQNAIAVEDKKVTQPMAQAAIESFSFQLERMEKMINISEERCHSILNLRSPSKPDQTKETAM